MSAVLLALRDALGGWCGRGLLGHALGLVVWARLSGVCLRMERLAERFLAGRVWRVMNRRSGAAVDGAVLEGAVVEGAVVEDAAASLVGGLGVKVARLWPGRFAWLVRMAGWQAVAFGSQLRAVLETPDMVALLEACPQAGRLLRPICRMLAVKTSVLRLPVSDGARKRIAAALVTRPPGRVRVRSVDENWRIPLLRGVLAAARRQGFGRIRFEKG